jgi:hypothetical protein
MRPGVRDGPATADAPADAVPWATPALVVILLGPSAAATAV